MKHVVLLLALFLFIGMNVGYAQWTQVNNGLADTTLNQDDVIMVSFTDCVNVHAGPSTTDSILWCAPAGYAGELMGSHAVPDEHGSSHLTFWYVRFANVSGWCSSKYLRRTNLWIPNVNVLAVSGTNLFAGAGLGIFRSTDNGASWIAVNAGLGYQVQSLAVRGTSIFAGTQHGLFQSSNNGNNWTSIGLLDSAIDAVSASRICLFAETANGTYRSTNNGTTWSSFTWGNFGAIIDTTLFRLEFNGQIDLSNDNGTTWKMIYPSHGSSEMAWDLCVSAKAVFDYIESAEDGPYNCLLGLYWTGSGFVDASMNLPPSYLSCIDGIIGSISASGGNVAMNYAGNFFSTNSGLDWKVITWPPGVLSPTVFVTLGSDLFVGGTGVWKNSLSDALPSNLASFKVTGTTLSWTTSTETNNYGFYVQRSGADISFVPGHGTTLLEHAYSYTDNPPPGQYQYRLRQVALDGSFSYSESYVVTVSSGSLPQRFALEQNYPNPFNLSTTIRYDLPRESQVLMTVFNTLGQQVATPVQGMQEVGYHDVRFDGSGLASGVYFYRLQAGSFVQTRKLVLLK